MKKLIAMLMGAVSLMGYPEAPSGYYDSCEGKTGNALLKALAEKVGPHKKVSYDGLWDVYKESDMRPDGTLWDMYSTKAWPANFTKCGNYKKVGDCVNREHSMPKNWWGGGKAEQYSDAYHLYPTDGYVNNQRSNLPFGECAGGAVVPSVGNVKPLGRRGTSTYAGYSGEVFEPDDMYKGDFARTYFYMAAAYNSKISSWNSDMLAKNSYPVFTTWAINMLLKWSRQDPVDSKETVRNDAVSKHQNNRNPFIDHPELAEYIWGDKVGQAWYSAGAAEPIINTPANGSVIDLGLAGTGVERRMEINVKGTALEDNVTATVSGNGFKVSPSTLSASEANGVGATLTVSYIAQAAGASTGTLTLRSGDATSVCTLTCRALDGLPIGDAYNVSDESFEFDWTCLDEDGTAYTIDVRFNGESLAGYPRQVDAMAEHAEVSDLEPETTYTYSISSSTMKSAEKHVTTGAPVPSVELLFDGELEFASTPGDASEVAEILVIIDNIPGNVTISVSEPFEVSLDKQSWGRSVELVPGEERFYMRMLGNIDGEFSSAVTITAEGFFYDDIDVTGRISDGIEDFHEDFEPDCKGSYEDKTFAGTACNWSTNCLFEKGSKNACPHEGEQAARFPKSGGYLTMLESKLNGIGTVSFWARVWGAEKTDAKFDIQISEDGGENWITAGSVEVPSNVNESGSNEYEMYSLPVRKSGSLRMRMMQTAGGRVLLDDLIMTSYRRQDGVSVANEAEYHSWDAYSRDCQLVLESDGRSEDFAQVYSIDGSEQFAGLIGAGKRLDVAPGVYVVVVRDFSRKVVVK